MSDTSITVIYHAMSLTSDCTMPKLKLRFSAM